MAMIPASKWIVYKRSDIGELYREYASATDMGAVVKSNGTISLSTTADGGSLFCDEDYNPKYFGAKNHRIARARKFKSEEFYKVHVKNRPNLTFYICTYELEGIKELPDTVIAGYSNKDVNPNVKNVKNAKDEKVDAIKDFIYRIDDSNKLRVQSQYDSIDVFFDAPMANDSSLDTLIIYTVDTKIPLVKLEKVEREDRINYAFIVDITNEYGDSFSFKSTISSKDQLKSLVKKTIDALSQYEKFNKYIEDLENCL